MMYILSNIELVHNKYKVKATTVLSSIWQVTLHNVRSKRQVSIRQTMHNKERNGGNAANHPSSHYG